MREKVSSGWAVMTSCISTGSTFGLAFETIGLATKPAGSIPA
jgi:hypothetical protein